MGETCSKCCTEDGEDKPSPGGSDVVYPSPGRPSLLNAIGSQVYIYKQDPSQSQVGYRVLWLPIDIRPGPVTNDVLIMGMPRIYRPTDNQGNFLYSPRSRSDSGGFDAVNTLSVVQHVLWMYRRVLSKGKARTLNWLWGSRPIQVYPYAGRNNNAYYSRTEKALKFFYFSIGGETIYASRSWDIVAHEAGHAVLDSLQPGWLSSNNAYTGALHESFGDVTAIFSVLDQLDMCELLVAHTKGNLQTRANFLAALGEEFGRGSNKYYGIRNASEDLSVTQVSEEVHDLSKVFTGAVYDVLVKIFVATLHLAENQPAETLYRAGRHLLSVFLFAILEAPQKNATFEDIANLMIKKEPQEVFKGFIREEFTRRGVFNEWARPQPRRIQFMADRTPHACGTHRVCAMKNSNSQNRDSLTQRTDEQSHITNNDFPINTKSNINQMAEQEHQDMNNSNKGSVSHRSVKQNRTYHYLDNSAKGSLSQRSVQLNHAHQHLDNSSKGSLSHRSVQLNHIHGHTDNSAKDSLSQRSVKVNQPHQNLPSSTRGSLSYRNVQQHLTHPGMPTKAYQGMATYTYQDTQAQQFAGSNGHTHYSRTTVDDRVWENHSATYSDNVFDSTEI